MKMIQWAVNIMYGNISEAQNYIHKAYALRKDNLDAACWCRDMASAHMAFNADGHELVKRLIAAHKSSDAYHSNPAYAEGMLDAWQSMHDDLIAKAEETRALISNFN